MKFRTFMLALAVAFPSAPGVAQDTSGEQGPGSIYIVGDSTAAEGVEGARGWGRHLQEFFDPARVRVQNLARGGRSSRTYVTEGLWQALETRLQPGDVVLIQFGHNDGGPINDPERARGSLPGLGDESTRIENLQTGQVEVVRTFGSYMRRMIDQTRERGAIPVILSLTVRNIWTDGAVERGSGRYSQWARELAEAEDVAFIDVTKLVADEYERMGEARVEGLFPQDPVHTSDAGARLNAQLITQGFMGLREEMWTPWLSAEGRRLPRSAPGYVRIPSVGRGSDEAGLERFLNTPHPADPGLPTLWLIGDSTVRTGRGRGESGQYGWGDPLRNDFDLSRINVVNRAMGGTGARTYRTGGFWQPVLDQLQPGDVVLIQFGHNDNGERGALPGTGTGTEERIAEDGRIEIVETFGAYLHRFVREIRDKQAIPVLFSLIPRKSWSDGRIVRSGDGHAAWTEQVASQEQVLFVDLYERIAERYDAMGPEAVEPMFADEGVHTSYDGAELNAARVMEGLLSLQDASLQTFLNASRARR